MRGADALILAPGDGIAASAGALGVPPALASPKRLSFPASRLVGSLPLGALRHDSWFFLSLFRAHHAILKKRMKILFQFQAPRTANLVANFVGFLEAAVESGDDFRYDPRPMVQTAVGGGA